uniref:Uncharacterized protein n=1 Tax=Trypanosoma congolense (strain IL3000) TaxID=1068625 RepID=G0UPG1_TRYCI|nr:conserved hypothetical protein [Trypanosoma congolense IL3000]
MVMTSLSSHVVASEEGAVTGQFSTGFGMHEVRKKVSVVPFFFFVTAPFSCLCLPTLLMIIKVEGSSSNQKGLAKGMCADRLQPMAPELATDLESLLTLMRDEAGTSAATESSSAAKNHPAVAFYCSERRVVVEATPKATDGSRDNKVELHVISLHQALFPPCPDASLAEEEEYSLRISSPEGLELLRTNWGLLLWLLMPSIRFGTSSGASDTGIDSAPIVSWRDLRYPLTWRDYTRLRQPGIMDRVHYSYVVFLRFYGWRLHNDESGELDRHRGWQARYELLAPDVYRCIPCQDSAGCEEAITCCPHFGGIPCPYSALTRILNVLLELCFNCYASNLVLFVIEEMSKGRLLFLQSAVEGVWLPIVAASKQVSDSDKEHLRRRLHSLTHSDSD